MKENKIPIGVTCHYERINTEWYVVWSEDFPGDEPGKKKVSDSESIFLEIGYQMGRLDKSNGF
jgi:hypothetical protein